MTVMPRTVLPVVPQRRLKKNPEISALTGISTYTHHVKPRSCNLGLSGSPVFELRDHLLPSNSSLGRYWGKYLQAFQAILYALLEVLEARPEEPGSQHTVTLCRDPKQFRSLGRYNVNELGREPWCYVVDRLIRHGFIRKIGGGFKGQMHQKGLVSVYSPTEKLRGWFIASGADLTIREFKSNPEPIVLTSKRGRKEPKKLAPYHDSNQTHTLRGFINKINVFQTSQKIGLITESGHYQHLFPGLIRYKRVFRDDFMSGGRIYCPVQGFSKERRSRLMLNGDPTVELDFKSHQLRILYHFHGLEAPGDCYDHPAMPRPLVKAAVTRVMNCGNRKSALGTLDSMLKERADLKTMAGNVTPQDLLQVISEMHPIIRETMSRDLWKTLQYKESLISVGVMLKLTEHGIPALNIHDSFIVPRQEEYRLYDLMSQEYYQNLRHWPVID